MGPNRFVKEVPNRFFGTLLMDDFGKLASLVVDGGLEQELVQKFWQTRHFRGKEAGECPEESPPSNMKELLLYWLTKSHQGKMALLTT